MPSMWTSIRSERETNGCPVLVSRWLRDRAGILIWFSFEVWKVNFPTLSQPTRQGWGTLEFLKGVKQLQFKVKDQDYFFSIRRAGKALVRLRSNAAGRAPHSGVRGCGEVRQARDRCEIDRLMKRAAKFGLTSLGSCLLIVLASAQQSTISGRVTDKNGNPVPGVLVGTFEKLKGGGYSTRIQNTGEDGAYSSYGDGQAIFFRKLGFQPITKSRVTNDSVLNVTLETQSIAWKLKQCPSEQELTGKRFGIGLLFVVPSAAKVRKGVPDTDNQKVWLLFPHNHKERLLIWSGVLLGGGISYFPDETWFLDGSVIDERLDATSGAMDVRGRTQDGKNWRSLSWATDIAEYHGVSEDAARFFDQIL